MEKIKYFAPYIKEDKKVSDRGLLNKKILNFIICTLEEQENILIPDLVTKLERAYETMISKEDLEEAIKNHKLIEIVEDKVCSREIVYSRFFSGRIILTSVLLNDFNIPPSSYVNVDLLDSFREIIKKDLIQLPVYKYYETSVYYSEKKNTISVVRHGTTKPKDAILVWNNYEGHIAICDEETLPDCDYNVLEIKPGLWEMRYRYIPLNQEYLTLKKLEE